MAREEAFRATPCGAFELLKDAMVGVDVDLQKAARGNKAATRRVRDAMQTVDGVAHRVQEAIRTTQERFAAEKKRKTEPDV